MLRPSSLLAPLTVRHRSRSTRGLLDSSLLPICCLLGSRACYPADWSIAGAGLAPARKAALIGCTGDFHHSAPPLRSLTEPVPRSVHRFGLVGAGVP
jgi:hypothetical protein